MEGSRFRFREALEMQTLWSGTVFEHPIEYIVDPHRGLVDATENFAEDAELGGFQDDDTANQPEAS